MSSAEATETTGAGQGSWFEPNAGLPSVREAHERDMAIIGAALCRVYAGRGAITALHTRLRDGDLSVELTHTGGEVSRVLLRPVKDTTGAASASHHAKGTRDVSGT